MATNSQPLASFESVIEGMKNRIEKLLVFFQTQSFTVMIDSKSTPLNNLYIQPVEWAVAAVAEEAAYKDSHARVIAVAKTDEALKDYYELLEGSVTNYTKAWEARQEQRKLQLNISNKMSGAISAINTTLQDMDIVYQDSMSKYQGCIALINNQTTLPDNFVSLYSNFVQACETITVSALYNNAERFNASLTIAQNATSSALADYFIAQYEHSTNFKKQLITKANLEALRDFNNEIIATYDDMPRTRKLTATIKQEALEAFSGLNALQHNMVGIINTYAKSKAIAEETTAPELGNFKFALDYNSYFVALSEYAKGVFKANVEKAISEPVFSDAGLSFNDVKENLKTSLSAYCGHDDNMEYKMYCSFASVIDIIQQPSLEEAEHLVEPVGAVSHDEL